MAATKHLVMIKGYKDGLVFQMNDQCEFSDLVEELKHKLEHSHQTILSGPLIAVQIKLGNRFVTSEQKAILKQTIASHGNLIVKQIESLAADETDAEEHRRLYIQKGIVRSGQSLRFEGDVLYVGDVNPGGTILSTGNIYILGVLKGMAHAGVDGDDQAIIAAALMTPTQLRISDVISRPPDEWDVNGDMLMEFAYLHDGRMEIDKLVHLSRIRPGAEQFIGG